MHSGKQLGKHSYPEPTPYWKIRGSYSGACNFREEHTSHVLCSFTFHKHRRGRN